MAMDYDKAQRKALWHRFLHAVLRKCGATLVSLAEARRGYVYAGQAYGGVQQIPVDRIVGSMDRADEFDHNFYPLTRDTRERWERVNQAYMHDVILPPIEVQKVGDDYFVTDGHHRVSVAKYHGAAYIDAEVTEFLSACQAA